MPDAGQNGPDEFPDSCADNFNRPRSIHHADTIRFSRDDGLVTFGDPVKKVAVAFFQPVTGEREGDLARAQAFGADFRRHVQQQGQIGPGVADGKINHIFDQSQFQPASVALMTNYGFAPGRKPCSLRVI